MKQIKFRGWHEEDKVMIYDLNSLRLHHGVLQPNDYKVMQFTGLLDKNGKEIFEGDIISFEYGVELFDRAIIKWDNNNARFYPDFLGTAEDETFYNLREIEIIGNIHENPDLITNSQV